MKAREQRTASSGWRVDTGQRAGKASLLVLKESKGKERMLVDLSELEALVICHPVSESSGMRWQ